MDLSTLDLKELKALAYDQLVLLQQTQNNIRILEEEIRKRNQETTKLAEKPT